MHGLGQGNIPPEHGVCGIQLPSLVCFGPSAINVLPLKTQIKHRATSSPPLQYPLKCEITFSVRGAASQLLANVYLHYVFDLWADIWRRKVASGDVIIVRYADDLVMVQHRTDAERFLKE